MGSGHVILRLVVLPTRLGAVLVAADGVCDHQRLLEIGDNNNKEFRHQVRSDAGLYEGNTAESKERRMLMRLRELSAVCASCWTMDLFIGMTSEAWEQG